MPLASWIVCTHYRDQLLDACLQTLHDAVWPAGWEHEIVVGCHEDDVRGQTVAMMRGAKIATTRGKNPGPKKNAALAASHGELVLSTDDDDMQSPMRPRLAVEAYEEGWKVSGIREFRYLHLENGHVVRWCGRGTAMRGSKVARDMPPVFVGTARNYKRSLLMSMNAWKDIPSLVEKDLQGRIAHRYGAEAKEKDLGIELANTTICVQHGSNIWGDRPCVPRGQEVIRGNYILVGEGHWSDVPGFPPVVAERLGLS